LTVLVLDASVAAKFVLPFQQEPLVAQAARLLGEYARGSINFMVPDLFWAELGNVLWNAVRRKRITTEAAENALAFLQARNFPTLPSAPLLGTALTLAIRYDRTVYDCIYIALARELDVQFLTADERLVNSLAAQQPVRWLGAL